MPNVTGNVRTWGFEPFPADERLLVRFVPSSAGAAAPRNLFPGREERVEPAPNGSFTVNLAQTTNVTPDVWFTIQFEWFDRHPIEGWVLVGSSQLDAKLRVPAGGGQIVDLLETAPPPGAILHGFGPPPDFLSGVIYIDRSGERPILYAPKGALI